MDSLPKIGFYNEKGNVKVGVRNELRNQILAQLQSIFDYHKFDKVKNVQGGFSLCLGIDENSDTPIWAHIALTVNDKDPKIDPYTGRAKPISSIEIPNLFPNG